jgi:hypothetical protein
MKFSRDTENKGGAVVKNRYVGARFLLYNEPYTWFIAQSRRSLAGRLRLRTRYLYGVFGRSVYAFVDARACEVTLAIRRKSDRLRDGTSRRIVSSSASSLVMFVIGGFMTSYASSGVTWRA